MRLTERELAEIRARHEQGEVIFDDSHFVHGDRRKLLAELDATRAERDEAKAAAGRYEERWHVWQHAAGRAGADYEATQQQLANLTARCARVEEENAKLLSALSVTRKALEVLSEGTASAVEGEPAPECSETDSGSLQPVGRAK